MESPSVTLKGYPLITSTYLDAERDGTILKIRFQSDPDSPIWTGAGSIDEEAETLMGLNTAGRELAHLIGKLNGVNSVELLSFEEATQFICLVVVEVAAGSSLRRTSVDVRDIVATYCSCTLGEIDRSEIYDRSVERELSTPELASASQIRFFGD